MEAYGGGGREPLPLEDLSLSATGRLPPPPSGKRLRPVFAAATKSCAGGSVGVADVDMKLHPANLNRHRRRLQRPAGRGTVLAMVPGRPFHDAGDGRGQANRRPAAEMGRQEMSLLGRDGPFYESDALRTLRTPNATARGSLATTARSGSEAADELTAASRSPRRPTSSSFIRHGEWRAGAIGSNRSTGVVNVHATT